MYYKTHILQFIQKSIYVILLYPIAQYTTKLVRTFKPYPIVTQFEGKKNKKKIQYLYFIL